MTGTNRHDKEQGEAKAADGQSALDFREEVRRREHAIQAAALDLETKREAAAAARKTFDERVADLRQFIADDERAQTQLPYERPLDGKSRGAGERDE